MLVIQSKEEVPIEKLNKTERRWKRRTFQIKKETFRTFHYSSLTSDITIAVVYKIIRKIFINITIEVTYFFYMFTHTKNFNRPIVPHLPEDVTNTIFCPEVFAFYLMAFPVYLLIFSCRARVYSAISIKNLCLLLLLCERFRKLRFQDNWSVFRYIYFITSQQFSYKFFFPIHTSSRSYNLCTMYDLTEQVIIVLQNSTHTNWNVDVIIIINIKDSIFWI